MVDDYSESIYTVPKRWNEKWKKEIVITSELSLREEKRLKFQRGKIDHRFVLLVFRNCYFVRFFLVDMFGNNCVCDVASGATCCTCCYCCWDGRLVLLDWKSGWRVGRSAMSRPSSQKPDMGCGKKLAWSFSK